MSEMDGHSASHSTAEVSPVRTLESTFPVVVACCACLVVATLSRSAAMAATPQSRTVVSLERDDARGASVPHRGDIPTV